MSTDLREQFAARLAELGEVESRRWSIGQRGTETGEELVMLVANALLGAGYVPVALRKKKKRPSFGVKEIADEIRAEGRWDSSDDAVIKAAQEAQKAFREKWDPVSAGLKFRARELESEMAALAPRCPIIASESYLVAKTSTSYNFATQGLGAESYARGDAERARIRMSSTGARVEVVRCPKLDEKGNERVSKYGIRYPDFEVRAYVASALDVAILKRLYLGLREEVRLCWKNGMNPRVLYGSLPFDYEERNDLDRFGNDLRLLPGHVPYKARLHEEARVICAARAVLDYVHEVTLSRKNREWTIISRGRKAYFARDFGDRIVVAWRLDGTLWARRNVAVTGEKTPFSASVGPEERVVTQLDAESTEALALSVYTGPALLADDTEDRSSAEWPEKISKAEIERAREAPDPMSPEFSASYMTSKEAEIPADPTIRRVRRKISLKSDS